MASCGTPEAKQGRGQVASLGGFMGSLGRPIDGLWEAFWNLEGPFGGLLGPWGPLGASWGLSGPPGDLLGASWEPARGLGGLLRGKGSKYQFGLPLLSPSWDPLGAILEPLWGPPGQSLGLPGPS